jgi:hypothetical protein
VTGAAQVNRGCFGTGMRDVRLVGATLVVALPRTTARGRPQGAPLQPALDGVPIVKGEIGGDRGLTAQDGAHA